MKNDKTVLKSFYNFLEDTEGLTEEDMASALEDYGIDVSDLKMRVAGIVREGSEKRRMAWRDAATKERSRIEMLLDRKKVTSVLVDLKTKIDRILAGYFGKEAATYAEAYFRKRDSLTEKDLESLIEDLEDLNLLDGSDEKE